MDRSASFVSWLHAKTSPFLCSKAMLPWVPSSSSMIQSIEYSGKTGRRNFSRPDCRRSDCPVRHRCPFVPGWRQTLWLCARYTARLRSAESFSYRSRLAAGRWTLFGTRSFFETGRSVRDRSHRFQAEISNTLLSYFFPFLFFSFYHVRRQKRKNKMCRKKAACAAFDHMIPKNRDFSLYIQVGKLC